MNLLPFSQCIGKIYVNDNKAFPLSFEFMKTFQKVSFVFNILGIITTITLKMNCKVIFTCTFRMSYSVRNTDR